MTKSYSFPADLPATNLFQLLPPYAGWPAFQSPGPFVPLQPFAPLVQWPWQQQPPTNAPFFLPSAGLLVVPRDCIVVPGPFGWEPLTPDMIPPPPKPVWMNLEISGRWVNELLRRCRAKELRETRCARR